MRTAALVLALFALAPPAAAEDAPRFGVLPPELTLVETAPVETVLDHADVPEAYLVWIEMLEGAQHTVELGQFYAVSEPDSRLELVIEALAQAGRRGVTIRFLTEDKFYEKDPVTVDRLAKLTGVTVRRLKTGASMGGVLHAKYIIVDGRDVFVGSQNFDWRALTHNHELGLRIQDATVAGVFRDIFEMDWALADGATREAALPARPKDGYALPVRLGDGDDALLVTPVASPKGWLPDERLWDLPRILDLIDGAKTRIRVQVMSYGLVGYDGEYWDDLDTALRRAAARGVEVEMLVADWSQKPKTIESLQSLEPFPHITVKIVTIPPWSGGFLPYARVIHAKYLVVDDTWSWVGTSNWQRDYFHASRNLGLIVQGAALASRLNALFEDLWRSDYAKVVDPCRRYQPPRIAK